MSINNKTWVTEELITSAGLNEMSADANNAGDNIHPQYLQPIINNDVFYINHYDAGGTRGFYIFQFRGAQSVIVSPTEVLNDESESQVVAKPNVASVEKYILGSSFIKKEVSSIKIRVDYALIKANSGHIAEIKAYIKKIDSSGNILDISAGVFSSVATSSSWKSNILESSLDISGANEDDIISVAIRSKTDVSAGGGAIGFYLKNLVITPTI